MKVGDIVMTPDGKAKIKFFEDYSRINARRVCVEMMENKEKFAEIVCYWNHEITDLLNNENQTQISF